MVSIFENPCMFETTSFDNDGGVVAAVFTVVNKSACFVVAFLSLSGTVVFEAT